MSDISVRVEYVSAGGDRPLSKTIRGLSKNTGLQKLSDVLRNELEIDQNVPLDVKLLLKIFFPPNQGN